MLPLSLFVAAVLQEDLTLSPSFVDILENSSLVLTCSSHMNLNNTRWGTYDQTTTYSTLNFETEGQCKVNGFLNETKYYETLCYSNNTFNVKMKRVDSSHHGQEWYCSHYYAKSNSAYIYVRGKNY